MLPSVRVPPQLGMTPGKNLARGIPLRAVYAPWGYHLLLPFDQGTSSHCFSFWTRWVPTQSLLVSLLLWSCHSIQWRMSWTSVLAPGNSKDNGASIVERSRSFISTMVIKLPASHLALIYLASCRDARDWRKYLCLEFDNAGQPEIPRWAHAGFLCLQRRHPATGRLSDKKNRLLFFSYLRLTYICRRTPM